jgi:uncharacterized protein YndB with AHSA1/START domain
MTTDVQQTSIRTEVVVEAPIDRAFRVFTEEMQGWWHPDHHLIETEEMIFEPRVGGHIYDRGPDGTECRWARVLAYDPPSRLVFSWDITTDWKLETDLEKASEVEVRFTDEGGDRTRVELVHRNLERHGDGWGAMRDSVGSEDGWPGGLRSFAAYLAESG